LEAVLGSWRDLTIHPYTSKALERENLVTTTMIIIPIAMSSGIIRTIERERERDAQRESWREEKRREECSMMRMRKSTRKM
jgi:hypothetical protein